jgi:DNA-binding MarR family transcriptional regulator
MVESVTQRPLIALLQDVQRAMQDELHARLRAEGWPEIRPSHGCVFGGMGPEGARLTDLAERARLTKQSVGEIVTNLEELGYVERVPDPEDKRAKLVRLTPRGQEVQKVALATFAEIEAEWAERIGKKKVADLRAALEELSLLPPLVLSRAA